MELPHLLNQNARAGSEPGGCFFVIVESRRQEMERTVGIKGKEEFFGELEQDWLAIDKGGKAPEPIHRVYFESAEVLSKVITRQRHNLLKVLHANGPLTVRALATLLERDYKNVYEDVKILEGSGLIERDSKNHVLAPYEKLTIELPLTA